MEALSAVVPTYADNPRTRTGMTMSQWHAPAAGVVERTTPQPHRQHQLTSVKGPLGLAARQDLPGQQIQSDLNVAIGRSVEAAGNDASRANANAGEAVPYQAA